MLLYFYHATASHRQSSRLIVLPAGMYHLNDNPSLHFRLNRLVNMDMGDLDKVREFFYTYFEEFLQAYIPLK